MRRNVQIVGWTLIWSGVFVFGWLGFQLYGTDLINDGVQAEAAEGLGAALITEPDQPPEEIDSAEFLDGELQPGIPAFVSYHPETPPDPGEAFAFIRIPKLGVDEVVFEGVDRETLKSGPGHMEGTPLPGQPGNAVLSGHRTTYGRPFFDFDKLAVGDRIEVETFVGTHVYEVRDMAVVLPTDVWVIEDRPGGWLTLTTCNPKFSAKERLVVWAEMVEGPNLDYVHLHAAGFGA